MPNDLQAIELELLASLEDGPKAFHMGRTPVQAIAIGWELCARKLATTEDGRISITEAGRQLLKSPAAAAAVTTADRTDPAA